MGFVSVAEGRTIGAVEPALDRRRTTSSTSPAIRSSACRGSPTPTTSTSVACVASSTCAS
jgi:hypothetical protein